jgi:hypothetical protein
MISDSLLRGVYLFTDLSAEERTSMARIAEEMSLTAGFPIFRTGDPSPSDGGATSIASFVRGAGSTRS